MDVRLPDGTIIQNVPDGFSKADLVAKLKSNGHDVSGLDSRSGALSGRTEDQIPGKTAAAPKEAPPDGIGDRIYGALMEAPTTLVTGIAGGVVGPLAGIYKGVTGGKFGTAEGTMEAEDRANNVSRALTYIPRTQTGRDVVKGIGNVLDRSGVIGIAPMVGELSALSRAARPVVDSARVATDAAVSAPGRAIAKGLDSTSRRLMQSALKPTIAELRKGNVGPAIQTLLDNSINVTKGGVAKLRDKISTLNEDIASRIEQSGGTVSRQKAMGALDDTRQRFTNQVSPAYDLNAIDSVAEGFSAHPLINGDNIPVQLAQKLKQGTYAALSKKYGQIGSAETEAQKALARGLKEGVVEAVPEVAGLNAKESALINALNVSERRVFMDANKNPMGLAAIAANPAGWAAFMADRSALFKSLAGRAAYGTSKAIINAKPGNRLSQLIRSEPLTLSPEMAAAQSNTNKQE